MRLKGTSGAEISTTHSKQGRGTGNILSRVLGGGSRVQPTPEPVEQRASTDAANKLATAPGLTAMQAACTTVPYSEEFSKRLGVSCTGPRAGTVTKNNLKFSIFPQAEGEPRLPRFVVDQSAPPPGVAIESVDSPLGPQGHELPQKEEPSLNCCKPPNGTGLMEDGQRAPFFKGPHHPLPRDFVGWPPAEQARPKNEYDAKWPWNGETRGPRFLSKGRKRCFLKG